MQKRREESVLVLPTWAVKADGQGEDGGVGSWRWWRERRRESRGCGEGANEC